MENIQTVINRFFEKRKTFKNHRYESWEHCYSHFQTHFKKEELSDEDVDYLALHLAFYLASWGMYRGSSFLLQRDYKVLIPVVRVLLEEGKEFTNDTLSRLIDTGSTADVLTYVSRYFKFDTRISKELENIRKGVKDEEIKNEVSYTLRTKIILGTLGCIPAYDRFFKDGIKLNGVKALIQSYSKNGLQKLIEFCRSNITSLKEVQKSINELGFKEGYPMMKIIDMYFFQLGLEKENRDKKKKR